MLNRECPYLWKNIVLEPCCRALDKEGDWQAKNVTGWTNKKYYVSSRYKVYMQTVNKERKIRLEQMIDQV